jgi:hypothetical protein
MLASKIQIFHHTNSSIIPITSLNIRTPTAIGKFIIKSPYPKIRIPDLANETI